MGRKKPTKGVLPGGSNPGIPLLTEEVIESLAGPVQLERARRLLAHTAVLKKYREGTELRGVFVDPLGDRISCEVSVKRYGMRTRCSCDDGGVCVHATALLVLALESPEDYLDLEDYLDDLEGLAHGELLSRLRKLIFHDVSGALEVLQEPGFVVSEVATLEDSLDPFGEDDDEDPWDVWEDDDDEPPPNGGAAH